MHFGTLRREQRERERGEGGGASCQLCNLTPEDRRSSKATKQEFRRRRRRRDAFLCFEDLFLFFLFFQVEIATAAPVDFLENGGRSRRARYLPLLLLPPHSHSHSLPLATHKVTSQHTYGQGIHPRTPLRTRTRRFEKSKTKT